jgi:hypothetical protein
MPYSAEVANRWTGFDRLTETRQMPDGLPAAARSTALDGVVDIRPPRTFKCHMKKRVEERLPTAHTSATATVAEAIGAEAIGAQAIGAQAVKVQAIGSLAIGALAVGAVAIGALALGRVVIGHLTVRRTRLGVVEIDELRVGRLYIREQR